MHQIVLEKEDNLVDKTKKNIILCLPSARRLTVHTAFGLPGNSETAISVT
jgi:hypothetical protein